MKPQVHNEIIYEWSYNPWSQDRFRTTGRFIVIILSGILGGLVFYQNSSNANYFILPAIFLLLALNLRFFLESHYVLTAEKLIINSSQSLELKHIIGWRLGNKYLRLVLAKPNSRPTLITCDLPRNTAELKELLTEKLGPMTADIEQLKALLNPKSSTKEKK